MIKLASTWKAHGRKSGILPCSIKLAIVVLFCVVVLFPVALLTESWQGVLALGAAAVICLASGLTSLIASALQNSRVNPFQELLVRMAFRLLPPLAACLLLAREGSGRDYLGFISYLLVFYMVTLSAETYDSIRRIETNAG